MSRTATPPRPAGRTARPARPLLTAFAAAAAVDLVAVLAGLDAVHVVAKPLLMPLLAGYAWARRAPGPLIAAVLCGWAGDVALLFDTDLAFLAGMGAFAIGHVCYLALFGRRRTSPALGLGYLVVLAVMVGLLWSDLPAGMRIPVAAYSVLLTAMAYRSSALGVRAAAGGALFLLSDAVIAAGVADWPRLPASAFVVMATYIAAQYLLVSGALGDARGDAPAYGEGAKAQV
ncbi:lysoplasmalogenase [Streptomyces sp. NPDC060194]|uniref:lysoplasmalogenase n=1 Tax=Streptomyces sp. NPDC060194 TaxID=3347069 RepID=UPI00365C7136